MAAVSEADARDGRAATAVGRGSSFGAGQVEKEEASDEARSRAGLGVARGTVAMFAAQGGQLGLTLVVYALISRVLPSVGAFGEFGLARAITLPFAHAADLGVWTILLTEIAQRPAATTRLYHTAQRLRIASTLACLPVVCLVIWAGGWNDLWLSVVLAGLVALTQYSSDIPAAVLLARRRVGLASILLVLDRALMLGCVALAVLWQTTAAAVLAGMLAANLLRMLVSLAMARATVLDTRRVAWSWRAARRLLRRGIPVGISLIVFAMYGRVGLIVMSKLGGDSQQLGLLTAATMIGSLLVFVPTTFGLTLAPAFAARWRSDRTAALSLYHRCFRVLVLAGCGSAAILVVFPQPLLELQFGAEYRSAAGALMMLALSLPFGFLNHVYRYFLVPLGGQSVEMAATVAGVLVHAVLAYWWIPLDGAVGAAQALLAAEVFVFSIKFLRACLSLGRIPLISSVVLPLLCAAGAATVGASAAQWYLPAGLCAFCVVFGVGAGGLELRAYRAGRRSQMAGIRSAAAECMPC